MKKEEKSRLCPFKKITETEHDGFKGKTITNERFAPCAGDRCMAYRPSLNTKNGKCARLESGK